MLNEKALKVLAGLSEPDAAYCHKMAKHFAAMGIPQDKASNAVCALVEADAIPEAGVTKWASVPAKKQAQPVAVEDLAYA